MALLILGMLVFAAVHFIPALAPALRTSWQQRFGENGYKGLFSLLLLASFGLLIVGWRGTAPTFLYAPLAELRLPALALLVFAFFLLVISNRPSRLRRIIRHPQLSGVALWGIAHLLLNGDSRSAVLFGGMAVWAVVEIWAINRRDGVWIKSEVPAPSADIVNVLATAVIVAVVMYIHPWLSGVAVL